MAATSYPNRPEARRAPGTVTAAPVPSIHYREAVCVAQRVRAMLADSEDTRSPEIRSALRQAASLLWTRLGECGYRIVVDADTDEWFVVDAHDGEHFRINHI